MIIFSTRSVLLLKVNVCNLADFGTQNMHEKFSESHWRFAKNTSFFRLYLCAAGRPDTKFKHSKQWILPRFFMMLILSGYISQFHQFQCALRVLFRGAFSSTRVYGAPRYLFSYRIAYFLFSKHSCGASLRIVSLAWQKRGRFFFWNEPYRSHKYGT